jgi:hypothetical protein
MDDFDTPQDNDVERRLRENRPELSAVELDAAKQRVLTSAARQGGRGMTLRARLVTAALVTGLVASGGGAVLAASGGSSSNGSSANSQYCPPNSPGAGKPKHQGGGNKCGHPEGQDNNGNGNGNNGHGH